MFDPGCLLTLVAILHLHRYLPPYTPWYTPATDPPHVMVMQADRVYPGGEGLLRLWMQKWSMWVPPLSRSFNCTLGPEYYLGQELVPEP